MGDAVKIAVKAALIAVITVAVFALVSNVQIPTLDVSLLATAVGKGKAIIDYYAGWLSPILIAGLFLLSFHFVLLPGFHIAMIAVRWVLKINE